MNGLSQLLTSIFGGDYPAEQINNGQIAARALAVYLFGLIIVRLGKSRMVSHASPIDIILGFILGSLLSRGITGHASLSGTAVSCAVLIGVHFLVTLAALRFHGLGNLLKGSAYPIIRDGQVLENNLRSAHLSRHDLVEALRLEGVSSVDQVAAAWKERNGAVSVIKRASREEIATEASRSAAGDGLAEQDVPERT